MLHAANLWATVHLVSILLLVSDFVSLHSREWTLKSKREADLSNKVPQVSAFCFDFYVRCLCQPDIWFLKSDAIIYYVPLLAAFKAFLPHACFWSLVTLHTFHFYL